MPAPAIAQPLPHVFPHPAACDWGEDEYGLWMAIEFNSVRQAFRWCPPGEFVMGSPEHEEGRYDIEIQHPVTLTKGFWLGETLVTQALWQTIMQANPSEFKGGLNLPVDSVSWNHCQQFIKELNQLQPDLHARLPTEAQWEYACRAGTSGPFSFKGELTKDKANYSGDWDEYSLDGKTTQVKHFSPNPWGLYDMHGNLYEWCEDAYKEYADKALIDPLVEASAEEDSGAVRVLRGGSWHVEGRYLRSACRFRFYAGRRLSGIGLRLCLDPELRPGLGGEPAPTRDEVFRKAERAKGNRNTSLENVVPEAENDVSPEPKTLTEKPTPPKQYHPAAHDWGDDEFGKWIAIRVNSAEQKFRWCPPGEFVMGSPQDENGRYDIEVQHPVTLTKGFWLGETLVTQALWQAIMQANPSKFKDNSNLPVDSVSWIDCQQFIKELNQLQLGLHARLPTEAQWEYACRAGTTGPFSFKGELNKDKANYSGEWDAFSSDGKTTQVKHFPANPWGLARYARQLCGNGAKMFIRDYANQLANRPGDCGGRRRI